MIDFDYLTLNGRNIRIHGNGFIQIDLELMGEVGQERVHIFGHPAIPRQLNPTPIHDHRFGFYSTVIRGRLVNVIYDLLEGVDNPTHQVYAPTPRQGEDTELQPTSTLGLLQVWRSEVMLPNGQYAVQPSQFHETLTNEPTITHMVKTTTTNRLPRVLCPIGRAPDNGFERYSARTEAQLWDIVEDSFRA